MQICNTYQLAGDSSCTIEKGHIAVPVFLHHYCTIHTKKNGHIAVSVFVLPSSGGDDLITQRPWPCLQSLFSHHQTPSWFYPYRTVRYRDRHMIGHWLGTIGSVIAWRRNAGKLAEVEQMMLASVEFLKL